MERVPSGVQHRDPAGFSLIADEPEKDAGGAGRVSEEAVDKQGTGGGEQTIPAGTGGGEGSARQRPGRSVAEGRSSSLP